jgi:four helix bundle protein
VEIKSYTDLIAWQKAMDLVEAVHVTLLKFPNETYALAAQMRRSSYSIPSNISEGHGRLSRRDYRHFLGNARGSLFEVQTQVHIAKRLKYVDAAEAQALLDASFEVGRILNGLIKSLDSEPNT